MKSMQTDQVLPEIRPYFPQSNQEGELSRHLQQGRDILMELLPEGLKLEEIEKWIPSNLPLIKWSQPTSAPESLSIFFLLSPNQEVKAEKVLLQIIQKWLIPEKEVPILGFYNCYFYMPKISSQLFFVAEVKIFVEDGRELSLIQDNLPLLANELSLSLSSSKYFEKYLDTKGLSLDQKSGQIQHFLRMLIQRAPKQFDVELFRDMSTFFALAHPEFRQFRVPKLLTRIVVSHYLMRKNLLHHLSLSPEKRHLEFHFIRSKLHFPFGVKTVLGLSIAVGLTDRHETFEDTHILSAVQKFIPEAQVVQGSYYFHRVNHDANKYIYLELEKKNGAQFQHSEILLLKRNLKEELKKRIEKLIPSVFMIRNEEEVMRNILLLSQQLKYIADLPQVMVNLDRQGPNELYFTVLLVRILKNDDISLKEAFEKVPQPFRFLADRVQNVGYIRKKNPKEANVFHLCIPKDRSILRLDSSVNFYLARQKVISIITEALGEIRDYNGGMILKQGELFAQLKHAFAEREQELLENFFFALNPIEAQATSSLSSLEILFKLCLESIENELPKRESVFVKFLKQKNLSLAVVRTKDRSIETILNEELNQLDNFSKSLIQTKINFQGTLLQAFIYETADHRDQKQFKKCIESAIEKWISRIINLQELRLSFVVLPPVLDPRLGGDDISSAVMKMLFEGLTRMSCGNQPSLALAKSIDISADQKRYTFKLRHSSWSDQTPLVAHDFEYAWKRILSPSFYTPFAHFFYPIKNAKAAKEGKIDLDQVGVKAIDDTTLVVHLETPTPEFLELTSLALYSPIKQEHDTTHPNWASQSDEEIYVCNGPFRLKGSLPNGGCELVKNQTYWDERSVKLDRVLLSQNSSATAYEMYKNDELEWMGRPMHPWEPHFKEGDGDIVSNEVLGVNWSVFNTQRFPFDNLKMRLAFKLALDRKKIIKEVADGSIPFVSPLPFPHAQVQDENLLSVDRKLAVQLFEEALKELGVTRKTFPLLTLIAGSKIHAELNKLLIKQWEDVLGIPFRFEEYDFNLHFSKMARGEYQIGMMGWKASINDPTYTLNVFEFGTNKINFAKWENRKFQELLEKAKKEVVQEKRFELFKQAEMVLIEECPVIPINSRTFTYMHKKRLKNTFSSAMGNIDFKNASIVP
ncbi:MAG: peptide ABC transporter substrate-binding protein [Verrucomicrobia bacterium]|nr:peptide ABC transporter substrate-binding protein [Verrucomicrobiota bacterium]